MNENRSDTHGPLGEGGRTGRAAHAPRDAGQQDGHGDHDALLVVRFAAGDVTPAEAEVARRLLATCPDCRLLASDLRAIARATAELPAPTRTRDFRLSPEVAARLRRSGWRGWFRRLGDLGGGPAGRLVVAQRLAGAAVAIGLVMALATWPAGVPGLSAGPTALQSNGQIREGAPVASAAPAPAATPAAPAAASAASAAAQAAAPAFGAAGPGPGASAAPRSGTSGPAAPSPIGAPSPLAAMAARPGASAGSNVASGRVPPASGAPSATGEPIEAWQVWLLLAGAGLVAFAAIFLARRRVA